MATGHPIRAHGSLKRARRIAQALDLDQLRVTNEAVAEWLADAHEGL